MKIQLTLCYSFLRRPLLVRLPGVGTSLKCVGSYLGRQAPLVLQPIGEPGRFYFRAKIFTGIAAKINVTQFGPMGKVPPAVVPGTRREIIQVIGILLLEFRIDRGG